MALGLSVIQSRVNQALFLDFFKLYVTVSWHYKVKLVENAFVLVVFFLLLFFKGLKKAKTYISMHLHLC